MQVPDGGVSLDALSQIFALFGEHECRDYSPLYERVCAGIAEDRELLGLAAQARHWPVPNVFLAAVHFLLLEGAEHPLAAYYPSVAGIPPPTGDPFPLFRQFCLGERDVITRLLETRLTQTNEVGRCAYWLPAFRLVASKLAGQPLAMVEVGASAGLNLLWDRYGYDYGGGRVYGDASSPVRLRCEWRGAGVPVLAQPGPEIVYRLGLDLNPIDPSDSDEALWLRALVWPEHAQRAKLLCAAVEVARKTPPPLLRGNALELLPDVFAAVPAEATLCVYHSMTLNQFSGDEAREFSAILAACSHDRPVYRLSMEFDEPGGIALRVLQYENGERTDRRLARCHPHGQWIDWAPEGEG